MEMNKELCFVIEKKKLYLEKILVEYNDIPIFYLCRNDDEYYLVLCSNIDEEKYIIVKPARMEVLDMLNGKLSMRDIILRQESFWKVVAGEDISMDSVEMRPITQIEYEALPYEDAFYEIPSPDMEEYVRQLESQLLTEDYKEIYEKQQDIQGIEGYLVEEPHYLSLEKASLIEAKVMIEIINSFENLLSISAEDNRKILQGSFSETFEVEKKIIPESARFDFQIDNSQIDMFIAA